ncbi:hypothetical protein, variant [Aphanomyces astaci]|uniref:t-SNARE coiled-coil homology domain-containing protein n=1 Tax=Aphanomyces astaci TaxID=112090 RepID=W4GEX5_APHAT|nr:hypothetical protein, variant [Aphanomyces astaci]ETV78247.1 hypothetical protein, variant [Aphanomyces astaci]|eukprot:XP_009832584.1 hypothetical protein, variant [Aphanomyces astaci]
MRRRPCSPRSLIRSSHSKAVWMPTNATSATSQNRRGDKAQHNTTPQPVVDLPIQALLDIEGKVTEVEMEVNALLDDLRMAASVFSAQMQSQTRLLEACRSLARPPMSRAPTSPHSED